MIDPLTAALLVGAMTFLVILACCMLYLGPRRKVATLPEIPADMPSPVDPMATNGSGSMFQESLRQMIQQAVAFEMRGRTSSGLDGIPSQLLALELIARGWIAYLPKEPK